MTRGFDLSAYGLTAPDVLRNTSLGLLYEDGLVCDGEWITSSGALATNSGDHTGRSPRDRRIVEHPDSAGDVDWGSVNIKLSEKSFASLRKQAVDYLNTCGRIYVVDGYAGWDPARRLKVRAICARPYHALVIGNLLIRPTATGLAEFDQPDVVIYNAGQAPADPKTTGLSSAASVGVFLEGGEIVILGTEYAGEMKDALFTLLHYRMPKCDVLSLRCAANEGEAGDVSLFFGLSGAGKSTLAADPHRRLIGDDEHGWSADGVFNFEGGCYARCHGLSAEKQPDLHRALRFGTVLENVVVNSLTREVDFNDDSLTDNSRAAFPLDFLADVKIPCAGRHPSNLIFLSCDSFGVLPPVSRLTPEQAIYHFLSGYSSMPAEKDAGMTGPQATFSPCFGAELLVWNPLRYAEMLAERMRAHHTQAWLINTGCCGGPGGNGRRIDLAHTRATIDSIHSGHLLHTPTTSEAIFGLHVPKQVPGVPAALLHSQDAWADAAAYRQAATKLADLFQQHFQEFAAAAGEAVRLASPQAAVVASA